MKLLHTADWHLGKRLGDYLRLEEQRAVMNEICTIAEEEAVDAVLIAGDLYDTFNPGNEAQELFYKTVHRLSNHGKRAVIAIAGNHDSPDRIEAPDPLARACGIIFHGRQATQIPDFATDCGLRLLQSAPGFVELALPEVNYPLRLLLTPYANEVTLRHYLGDEDKEQELRKLLRQKWQFLADQYCDAQGVNVMVAHLYFMQKDGPAPEEPDDEKPILHMGGAQAIYTEDIPVQMQYVALGHLHRYQTIARQPCPVVYSSSPLAYSFSEAHQQKYVAIIEAEPGQEAKVRPICLQQGRQLVRKRFETTEAAIAWLQDHQHTFVELTLVSDTYIDSQVKKALYEVHDGIVSIIPDIQQEQGIREEDKPKIDLNEDIRVLFADYFRLRRGQPPNPALMNLLNEVIDVDDHDQ